MVLVDKIMSNTVTIIHFPELNCAMGREEVELDIYPEHIVGGEHSSLCSAPSMCSIIIT